jgi:hypothetical protein
MFPATVRTKTIFGVYSTATMALDTTAAFGITVTFVIPLVALLMQSLVMWCEEYLWNSSVLGVHLSILV